MDSFDSGTGLVLDRFETSARALDGTVLHAVETSATPDRQEDGALIIHLTARNQGSDPVRLLEMTVRARLALDGDWRAWRVYKTGWCVASPAACVPLASRESSFWWRIPPPWMLPGPARRMFLGEDTRFARIPGVFESEWVLALVAPDGRGSVAIGTAGFEHHFTRVRIDAPRGTIEVAARLDGAVLPPGDSRPIEPVSIVVRPDLFDALRAWAGVAASRGFSRVRPLRLWCSWYSGFHDRIDEPAILENLAALRPHSGRIECFQVDDGWQRTIGDWTETNERFPSGLDSLARRIAGDGFLPGLWLAPFSVSPRSEAFRERPDLVIRDESGRPVRAGFVMGSTGPRFYHALDTTHPDTVARLSSLFRRLWDMGWRVFKLDFLTAASVPGRRADPGATGCEAYRRGLRAIREALPPEAVLLAGISPVFAGAGIVDAQRLGPDTFYGRPAWRTLAQRCLRDRFTPGVANAVSAVLARCFADGVLFSGDTDAALGWGVDADMARLLEAVTLLAGGTSGVGHDFRAGAFDFSFMEEVLRAGRAGARVLDLSEGSLPRHLMVETAGGGLIYAILNPGAGPASVTARLPPGAVATDLLTGERLSINHGTPVPVPRRSARVLSVRSS